LRLLKNHPKKLARRYISNEPSNEQSQLLVRAARNLLHQHSLPSTPAVPSAKYELIKKQKAILPLKLAIEKYDQLTSKRIRMRT